MQRFSKISTVLSVAVSAIALSSPALAGEAEDKLIAKVAAAYGGDELTDLQTIRIRNHYRNSNPGQGYTSEMDEFLHIKQDVQLDLSNQRGSVEAWSANWNFINNNRTVSVGDDIVNIDYNTGRYQPGAGADYYAAYGAIIRVTDTLLAYQLVNSADTAEHKGLVTYLGRPHEMIEVQLPSSPPLTLYVDEATGYISKSERVTGFGPLTYSFDGHTQRDGVTFARDFSFFVGSAANIVSVSRDVSVNNVPPTTFAIDEGIVLEPARIDQSELTVDEIAPGLHHVGQALQGAGPVYSTIIDAGDHLIAVGGSTGLAARVAAYRDITGSTKPLRYQIVSHHHSDHLAGLADAYEMGATFVTPSTAVASVRGAVSGELSDELLVVLDGKMTLGPVEIHEITTNHVEALALAFIPAANAVFQADHYTGFYEGSEHSPAGEGTVQLKSRIEELGLDVETVLSAHGRKAVSWSELSAAVAAYSDEPCKSGRPICIGMK